MESVVAKKMKMCLTTMLKEVVDVDDGAVVCERVERTRLPRCDVT
jgi:hypothetical protein